MVCAQTSASQIETGQAAEPPAPRAACGLPPAASALPATASACRVRPNTNLQPHHRRAERTGIIAQLMRWYTAFRSTVLSFAQLGGRRCGRQAGGGGCQPLAARRRALPPLLPCAARRRALPPLLPLCSRGRRRCRTGCL
eukprot:SAG11_NODE_410_length_9703_cov_3.284777_9_plen_140_part_00